MDSSTLTTTEKRAIIIDALSREETSPEIVELIQGWIAHGGDERERIEVMEAIFDRMFASHATPTAHTHELLARLHQRLGLPAVDMAVERAAVVRMPLRRRFLGRTMLRVAAVVLPLALAIGGGWFALRSGEEVSHDVAMIEMMLGEGGVMTLPDGSRVRPMGEARVMVAENFAENRHAELSGEAFFEVVRDPARPFSVEAEGLTVTVLGTEFNFKAPRDDAKTVVSLLSGSVMVEAGAQSVTLAPMERLTYDRASGSWVVTRFNEEDIAAARSGNVELSGLPLGELLVAVGKFYGRRVVFVGALADGAEVNIVLTHSSTLRQVLQTVQMLTEAFDFEIEQNTIKIVGKTK